MPKSFQRADSNQFLAAQSSRAPHALAALVAAVAVACGSQSGEPGEKISSTSQSATAPPLGTTKSFSILAGSTVTNTGPTVVTGDLGVSPGLETTGFPPGLVTGGTIHAGDAVALQAQNDATTAYNSLAGQACDVNLTDRDLGGLTLTPGIYCFSSSAQLTGTLTLNAQGNPDAVFVFQMGSTLTTASDSSVVTINGANPCNTYWQVGSSVTLGTGTTFCGTIIAEASVTFATSVSMTGRAIARNGAVTMDTNTVSSAHCQSPIVIRDDGGTEAGDSGADAGGGDADAASDETDAGAADSGRDVGDAGTVDSDASSCDQS